MTTKIQNKIIEITSLISDRHTLQAKQGLKDLQRLIDDQGDKILKAINESKIISKNHYGEDDGTDNIKLIKYLIDRKPLKLKIKNILKETGETNHENTMHI